MQFGLEQRRQRFIDQTVTLQGFQSFEACGHDPQPEVPFASAAGMAGVRGTVVTHFQMRRLQALLQQSSDMHGDQARWGGHARQAATASVRAASQSA